MDKIKLPPLPGCLEMLRPIGDIDLREQVKAYARAALAAAGGKQVDGD